MTSHPGRGDDWRRADLESRTVRLEIVAIALHTMRHIARCWSLTTSEAAGLIGDIDDSTWLIWEARAVTEVSADQLSRISLLTNIHRALHTLYSAPLANAWVRRPNANPIFSGASPLQVMLDGGGPSMLEVHRLLEFLSQPS